MNEALLQINNVTIGFLSGKQGVKKVSFSIKEGETVALVGESGCGKSILCRSILGLLPSSARVEEGTIVFDKEEITSMKEKQLQNIRGSKIGMVWQDPVRFLHPLIPIGTQVIEGVCYQKKCSKKQAQKEAIILLETMGIDNANERFFDYPYQFSGGQLQRIVMATAMIQRPKLLIADEPTTALDKETEREIIKELKRLQIEQKMAMLLVTHDMSVAFELAHKVAVMREGQIIELGTKEQLLQRPKCELTKKLVEVVKGCY